MIRMLARTTMILLGLLLGLTLAAVLQGRMADLRLIGADYLPEWTARLSPDTGVRAGQMENVIGVLPGRVPVDLAWEFQRIDTGGIHYTLRISGPGGGPAIALTSRATLPLWPAEGWSRIVFSDLQGEIDLAPIYTTPRDVPLAGRMLLVDGAGIYDVNQRALLSLAGLGSLAEGRFDGVALGATRLTLSAGDPGEWLGTLNSTGAAITLQAQARGRFDQSVFALQGEITAGEDMPESWQRGLTQTLAKSGEAWVLPEGMDLQELGF